MVSVVAQMLVLGTIAFVIGAIIGFVVGDVDGAIRVGIIGAVIGALIGIPTGLVHRARMKVIEQTGLPYEVVRTMHNQMINEEFERAERSKR